jgi:hypothetical protein
MLDRCMATETGREILQTFGSLEFYDEKMSPDLIGFTAAGTFASCCSNTATPGYRIDRPLRPLASGHLLLRGAAVDAHDFGYLRPLGAGTGANFERRARRYAIVAAALDDSPDPSASCTKPKPLSGLYHLTTA